MSCGANVPPNEYPVGAPLPRWVTALESEEGEATVEQNHSRVEWRKSRYCGSGACVEVAKVDGHYLMRDSGIDQSPVLRFTEAEWTTFLLGLRAGDFDFE
jgi:Domain of unknown function (DUF397)